MGIADMKTLREFDTENTQLTRIIVDRRLEVMAMKEFLRAP